MMQAAGELLDPGTARRVRAMLDPSQLDGLWHGQARVPKDGWQLHSRADVHAGTKEGLVDALAGGPEFVAHRFRGGTGGVHLLKGHDAARPHEGQQAAEHDGRRGEIHQDEAADEGVDGLVEHQLLKLGGDELRIRQLGLLRALLRHGDGFGGLVHADDRAGRADDAQGEERDVARAAAEVKDAQPGLRPARRNTCSVRFAEEAALSDEAVELALRVTERVVATGWRRG
jgi:hypothetical protein